jgi:hypothetical protein
MPYIGKTPLTGAYQLCDTITTSATATYNLTVGSSPVIPGAAQNCIVSLNGVVQAPVSAYTVSGSTIVFSSTLSATDVIDFILILGNVFDIGKPTDGSVTNASIANSTIDLTTKVTGVLPVANGGTNLSSGFANGITMADQWRITATYSYSASQAYATLTSNWERVDTDGFGLLGTGMTQSSGVFTFPSTGIYLVTFTAHADTATNNARFVGGSIFTTTDGTNFGESNQINGNALASTMANNVRTTVTGQFQFDVTNVTTHKVRFEVTSNQNTTSFIGDTDASYTCAGFIRLGDT